MAFGLSVVITTVVLSSLRLTDAGTGADGVIVRLSTIPVVLGGDVNLTFHFPSNFSGQESVTLYAFVYDGLTSKKPLHTETSQLHNDSQTTTIHFPCTVFDHPASYYFKYRVSDQGQVFSINRSLTLHWGKIRLRVPKNHTALTRLGYWIEHKRRCLSTKYRDSINLYYLSDKSGAKVTVYNRTFKRLKLKDKNAGRTRMTFRCDVLDARGTYVLEYRSGFGNATLARSRTFSVYWKEFKLKSPQRTVHPCEESLPISFPRPECIRVGSDKVQVYEGATSRNRLLKETDVSPGMSSVFFACRLFKSSHYVGEYCFHFVTTSQKTKNSEKLAKLCIPAYTKEKSMTEGWGQWSPWGMCTHSCGEGKQPRYRYCLSTPSQSENCQGSPVEIRSCPNNPCPDNPHKCACGCQLTASEGMITSSPALFKKTGRKQCTWRINMRGNRRIKLWFDALKMDGDTILVRDGNDSSAPLLATVKDGFRSPILSKGNSMYIFYSHNGKWRNGTKRGFTASYRAQEEQFVWKKSRTLGTAEASFLAVFIFSILLLGIVLFAVFVKLRRQQSQNSSSGSSNTSESTSRSTLPSSPPEDEASSNEPLRAEKHFTKERLERTNKKRERHKRRRHSHRREYLCDVTMPRCSCAEMSGLESGSGSYSINESYNSPRRSSVERTRASPSVPPEHGCDCPQCLCRSHQCLNCDRFGVPSKKYFGDWMVTEGLHGNYGHIRPGDLLTYRTDSCEDCRNSNEDFV